MQLRAIEVNIEGVDSRVIRENIELLLDSTDLSKQTSLDPFWQKQIRDTVSKAVEPFGYYHSNTDSEMQDNTVLINVVLGTPLKITSLNRELLGDGRDNEAFNRIFYDYPQQTGDILNQPAYSKFKTDIFNYALSHGFFDFTWQLTSIDIVRESYSASVLLIAQSGPQYYFGDLRIIGDDKSIELVRRLAPFKTGQPYSAALLTEFNRILNETGYFQRVIARPVVREASERQVPIEINLTHRPRDNFSIGAGLSSDIGARVSFDWQRPWLNNKGHSISVNGFLSAREQEIVSQYRIPFKNVNTDYASFEIGYSFINDSEQSTDSETFSFTANRFWRNADSDWQFGASLGYLTENFTQGLAPRTSTQLLLPGLSANYLDATGDLGRRVGLKISSELQAASQALLSDIDIVKAQVDSLWIQSFDKHRLYLRGQLGAISTNEFSSVPATLRFFTGGDQTIRGFQFQSISSGDFIPDPENSEEQIFVPQGGQFLATASIEYAYPISENWRAAVFVDAGGAVDDFGDGLATSFGVGAHWLTIIGPIRLYLAFGRNRIENDNSVRFHFILGPEL